MIAVALDNSSLQKLLEDTTKDWMKTGFIVAAEKKWGITPTEYSLSCTSNTRTNRRAERSARSVLRSEQVEPMH